jgi:hypothetical protein
MCALMIPSTCPVRRLTVKWLQVAEDSFRVHYCWVALFPRFPSADLKIAAIPRIVVGWEVHRSKMRFE